MGLEGSDRVNREVYNRKETSDSFLKAARTVLDVGTLALDRLHHPQPLRDRRRICGRSRRALNALPRPNWWIVCLSLTPFPGHAALRPLRARTGCWTGLPPTPTTPCSSRRPGGYRTPAFWLDLITVVLPNVNPALGERLIAAGPEDPQNAATVRSLAKWFRIAKQTTGWLRDRTPWLYSAAYRVLRRAAPLRSAPGEMNVVD